MRDPHRFVTAALAVARKDAHRTLRDRGGLAYLLALPIVLMATVGYARIVPMGERQTIEAVADVNRTAVAIACAVRACDSLTLRLVVQSINAHGLDARGVSLEEARAGLPARWPIIALLPADGHDAMAPDSAFDVDVVTLPDRRPSASVPATIGMAIAYVRGVRAGIGRPFSSADARAIPRIGAPTVQVVDQSTTPNAFAHVVGSYVVMFALFGIGAGAASVFEERARGTYQRILSCPVDRGALLAGKVIHQFALTATQAVLLFAIGAAMFRLELRMIALLGLLIMSLAFATTSFGMLLVSLAGSRRQLSALSTLTILTFSAIGGAWWPIWTEPAWLRTVAHASITYWAMSAFNGAMVLQQGAPVVLASIAGLFTYGIIAFSLAYGLFLRRRAV